MGKVIGLIVIAGAIMFSGFFTARETPSLTALLAASSEEAAQSGNKGYSAAKLEKGFVRLASYEEPPVQKTWYLSRATQALNNREIGLRSACYMTLEDQITGACGPRMGNAVYCKIGDISIEYCMTSLVIDCTTPSTPSKGLENCDISEMNNLYEY